MLLVILLGAIASTVYTVVYVKPFIYHYLLNLTKMGNENGHQIKVHTFLIMSRAISLCHPRINTNPNSFELPGRLSVLRSGKVFLVQNLQKSSRLFAIQSVGIVHVV